MGRSEEEEEEKALPPKSAGALGRDTLGNGGPFGLDRLDRRSATCPTKASANPGGPISGVRRGGEAAL
ncbi:hypothetical protein SKAU_G00270070 [Synaphobranchus kaupii]|uniref:Uncharacterized protein n=1 Tax=Synaphobranchus kaupii TaxID=118154 RepID=A0A9Q1INH0_SYNKA|nr:hypothetical protein SKAU_G00270070 [Synaphobranchus kaupii]